MRSVWLIPIVFILVMILAINSYKPPVGATSDMMTYEQMIESRKQDCVNEGGKIVYFNYYHREIGGYKKSQSFFCEYE